MQTNPSSPTEYSFEQHVHNYAVWTAARAVQRKFTTTANIKWAIEQTTLRSFAAHNDINSAEQYDELHKCWAENLIHAFSNIGVQDCTYGRAAKVISIYLKTSVLLCNRASCRASQLIHPPIDSILLKRIASKSGLKDLSQIRWTHLSKLEYWSLVKRLKDHFGSFDWRLEEYWTPERD